MVGESDGGIGDGGSGGRFSVSSQWSVLLVG